MKKWYLFIPFAGVFFISRAVGVYGIRTANLALIYQLIAIDLLAVVIANLGFIFK